MDNRNNIPNKFLKPYDPGQTEARIYKLWEDSGFFNPDNLPNINTETEPFTIMMPPPNVTGILHMGHALFLTLQDIMVRYKRMRGYKTLWLPGTDHAAIATQARVEKDIYKSEGKSRHDLGREAFLSRVDAFARESHDTIVSQVKVMGASCDWSREAFTLDEKRTLAVRTMFKNMRDDGLIYRGWRIVNWDPKGQTTISDDEIVYEERKAKLYTFRYEKSFPIPIATTRLETKLGDVGIAVHPDDSRYKEYIGKMIPVKNFAGQQLNIKIVGDPEIDPNFGTGAVGLTPAHSHIDWEIAARHELPRVPIINELAKMTGAVPTEYIGKKVTEAREMVVAWLTANDLIEKEEEITQNIATAERTGGIIEPLPKTQWFINVNKPIANRNGKTLKDLMRQPFETGEIKIIPEHFGKTYFHWISNLRDWCISRQIWYGHRIPVWYCTHCQQEARVGDIVEKNFNFVSIENPTACPKCKSTDIEQDPDTLDTWFSSGLWTFSTLGWPEQTPDLATFHPTDVLETGYEILFFWVARMILMTGYALGTVPFRTIYLHGTVRDGQGRKMSKSLGNGIDPIDMAKKFGTDAGRMALLIGNTPGTDTKISEEKIRGYKNFANKLWNITRFVLESTAGFSATENPAPTFSPRDNILRAERDTIVADITTDVETYRFYLAGEKLYHYIWHTFADMIIEESKTILTSGTPAEISSRKQFLIETLRVSIIIMHPFMPFVTEEIWNSLPWKEPHLLLVSQWPTIS